MNASPLSATPSSTTPVREGAKAARAGRSWILSLTGVCFIFGGLLAMQLRSIQQVRANQQREEAGIVEANKLAKDMKLQADKAAAEQMKLNSELTALRVQLAKNGSLTASQVSALNAQIKDLQTVAGLTPLSGPGVRITLSDNAAVALNGGDSSLPLPGLVHDFDLQQVVNELRLVKADGIAINGQRITGYTPIRCVGSPIMVNWETITAPYVIEAVGKPEALKAALEMPAGIVDEMRNKGGIGVKIAIVSNLKLPAAGGVPKLRAARATP